MDKKAQSPEWFNKGIKDGVNVLYSLSLKRQPSGDVLKITKEVWIKSLWRWPVDWDQKLDSSRIREMFLAAAGKLDEWPSPNSLKAYLPVRKQLSLPEPKADPENAARRSHQFRSEHPEFFAHVPVNGDGN